MKLELKEVLLKLKQKLQNDSMFSELLAEMITEVNYYSYYAEPIPKENVAEDLCDLYYEDVENLDKKECTEDIMKALALLEEDETFSDNYENYVASQVKIIEKEI